MGFGEIVLLMVIAFVLIAILLFGFVIMLAGLKEKANERLIKQIERLTDRQWDKTMERYKEFIKGITQS